MTNKVSVSAEELASLRADRGRLDYLDSQLGSYTGRVVCRMSETGRGLRLHETSKPEGKGSVREAIDSMAASQLSLAKAR